MCCVCCYSSSSIRFIQAACVSIVWVNTRIDTQTKDLAIYLLAFGYITIFEFCSFNGNNNSNNGCNIYVWKVPCPSYILVWDEYREWRWVVLHVCKGWNRHTDIFSLHTHIGLDFTLNETHTIYTLLYQIKYPEFNSICVHTHSYIYNTIPHAPFIFFRQFLVSSFSNSLVGVFFLRSSRFYYYWSYVWLFGSSLPNAHATGTRSLENGFDNVTDHIQ